MAKYKETKTQWELKGIIQKGILIENNNTSIGSTQKEIKRKWQNSNLNKGYLSIYNQMDKKYVHKTKKLNRQIK